MHYRMIGTCVGWPSHDVDAEGGLVDMIDNAIEVSRKTFLKYVDDQELADIEAGVGYDKDLRMKDDWHVSYHRSKLHGERVYFFKHSAIEHVFKEVA